MDTPAYLHQLESRIRVMQTPSQTEVHSRTHQCPEVRRDGHSIRNTTEERG